MAMLRYTYLTVLSSAQQILSETRNRAKIVNKVLSGTLGFPSIV